MIERTACRSIVSYRLTVWRNGEPELSGAMRYFLLAKENAFPERIFGVGWDMEE
ncbi:hypothetical protein J2Z47_002990 [Cohnella thailandensis]|nr:hypothetical protein [Cohnella thailandensis]